MKITIYGAGAVGGLVAGKLAQKGHDVSVVARGAHLTAIRDQGLTLQAPDGTRTVVRIRAESDPAKLGPQDYVIVTVKGQSLPDVAKAIAPLLGPDTVIVTGLNGVPWWFFDRLPANAGKFRLESLDPTGELSRAMPTDRIVGCVIHLAASTPEPGVIKHTMGDRLILGEPGAKNTDKTGRIADALKAAGFEVVRSPFIEKDFWVKLLGNISVNPVAALTLATTDRLLNDPYAKAYMIRIMEECLAIGRAIGVDADIQPEPRLDMARKLGAFKPSTLQDMEAGKSLEIDGLLTGTLELAKKAGVPAPFTESLMGLIRLRAQTTGQYR